ncbi:MAG: SGNH/GDSL hydrolase family protein [Planctomycetota bacterium]
MNAKTKSRLRRLGGILFLQLAVIVACELRCRSFIREYGVTPFQVSADPELSSELRPGFSTTYTGVHVRINSSGYRGAEFPAPLPGVPRIALIGDSYVFGSGVDEQDTLGASLERALTEAGHPCQVLAFGVPGYTGLDTARVLESRVMEHQPDLVLYVNFANDIQLPIKYTSIPPDAVIDPTVKYRLHSAAIEYGVLLARRVGWALGYYIGSDHEANIKAEYAGPGGAGLRAAIARMQAVCSAAGLPYQIAIYPHLGVPELDPLRVTDRLLMEEAPSLGVNVIDLLPAFEGERNLTHYWVGPFDSHPNAAGHLRASRFLADQLLSLDVITAARAHAATRGS